MTTATNTPVRDLRENLRDIQGNILGGFNKDYQSFLFLEFANAGKASTWIASLVNEVASAEEVRDFAALFRQLNRRRGGELGILKATWMNLAFTASGLDFLKVVGSDQFPKAFRDGMSNRAAIIGDVNGNAPGKWPTPIGKETIHALLMVASDSQTDLGENVIRYVHNMGVNGGVRLVFMQEGAVREDDPGHEHFGFRDGVSQPGVRHFDRHVKGGEPIQANPGQDRLQPGEFILGYPTQIPTSKQCGNDSAGNPITIDPNPDEGPISPNHTSGDETAPDWAVNGSYLVFRRLAQDVGRFHDEVQRLASVAGSLPKSWAPRSSAATPAAARWS